MTKSVLTTIAACLALVFVTTEEAMAQRGAVRGTVVDDAGNPLEGVEVTIELADGGGRPLKVKTKKNGQFVKAGIKVGTYRLSFNIDGFQPTAAQLRVSTGEQADAGTMKMFPLAPGTLTETEHAEAQQHLDAFNAAFNGGDFAGAVAALSTFIELVPDNAEAYFNLAAAHEKNQDDDSALTAYARVIELTPKSLDAHTAVAVIHARNKRWADASGAFAQAIELKPTDPGLHFNYAANAMNAGNLEGALRGFEEVTKLDPNHPMFALSHFQIGMIHVNQQDNDAAVPFLEKFVELEPESPRADTAREIIETLKAASGQS